MKIIHTVIVLPLLAVGGPTVACFGETISSTAIGAANYTRSFGGSGSQITLSPANSSVYLLTGSSAVGYLATLQFILTLTLNECVSVNEIKANENIWILHNPVQKK